jgi:hypothetical protein
VPSHGWLTHSEQIRFFLFFLSSKDLSSARYQVLYGSYEKGVASMWWLSWVGAGLPVARRVLSGVVGRVVGVRLLMMIFVFYTTEYGI